MTREKIARLISEHPGTRRMTAARKRKLVDRVLELLKEMHETSSRNSRLRRMSAKLP